MNIKINIFILTVLVSAMVFNITQASLISNIVVEATNIVERDVAQAMVDEIIYNITNTNSNTDTNSNNNIINNNVPTQTTCANGSVLLPEETVTARQAGTLSFEINKISSTQARIYVVNDTNCILPVTAQSYEVYDNVTSNTQVLISNNGPINVQPHTSYTFNVPLALCLTQVDAMYGEGNNTLMGVIFDTNGDTYYSISAARGNFCSVTPTPQPLSASCTVNPSNVSVGGYLNWGASASGGTGSYSYSWSGTDGLYGNASSVSRSYFTAGTKTGTVTVTSGSQSVSRTCSGVVTSNYVNDNLAVYCSTDSSSVDVDEDTTWRAYPSGGTGSYSYDWDGTDGLNGSSRNLTWSYDDNGTKRGTITVYSGGESVSASCTVRVEDNYTDDMSVSCYGSPATTQTGNQVRWYVNVNGGDGDYDYDWEGSENLNSSTRNPTKTYYTVGQKYAEVTVRDGDGNRETDTCYVNVNSVLAFSQEYQAPLSPAVYLSQVPYTGVADNAGTYWFMGFLALISAWIAYIVIARKRELGELN